jgi:hypothetical protein
MAIETLRPPGPPGTDSRGRDDFSGQLASILFDTPPPLGRAGIEARAVERFAQWFCASDAVSDVRLAAALKRVNGRVLPKLSGRGILQILRLVEERRPRLLPAIALAVAWQQRLDQARLYSDLLRPSALARLATALELEKSTHD